MDNAAKNICVQIYVWTCVSFFLGKYLGVDYLVYLLKNSPIFQSGCIIYIPAVNVWELQLIHIFANMSF